MIDLFYQIALWSSVSIGLLLTLLGLIGKKPSGFSLLATAIIEALLLVQLLISIWLVISGARAETDTLEFFGYLIVSLLVPVAAGFDQ